MASDDSSGGKILPLIDLKETEVGWRSEMVHCAWGERGKGWYGPDMRGYGKGEMLDVIVSVVKIPGECLRINIVGHEDVLVLTVAHGDGDGGVVKEEAISLPGTGSMLEPVMPAVNETTMKHL